MKNASSKPAAKASAKTTAKKTTPTKKVATATAAKKSSVARAVPKAATVSRPATVAGRGDTTTVLKELKSLAKELNKAAKGLGKNTSDNPKSVANILGSVERMTGDAANKSLLEAESAKGILVKVKDSLGKDWNRKEIEAGLKQMDSHLTNIIVAQEFQDLAGQAIRKAMKALVGAIIVVEGGGSTEENRLSQNEVDNLLNELMP